MARSITYESQCQDCASVITITISKPEFDNKTDAELQAYADAVKEVTVATCPAHGNEIAYLVPLDVQAVILARVAQMAVIDLRAREQRHKMEE